MPDETNYKPYDPDRDSTDIPNSDGITEGDLGVRGVSDTTAGQPSAEQPTDSFRDTFYAPRDKKYLDFLARRITKLRGSYVWYYVLTSQTEKLDDITPVSKNRQAGALDKVRHAGGTNSPLLKNEKGIAAMYGEPVIVGQRLSSVEREFTPSWEFASPIVVRGVLYDPERAEIPDQRGALYTQRIRLSLARVLCETEWKIRPRIGDMIRIATITNPPRTQDDYYDVEEVVTNDTRFGSTGFFTAFTLQLSRSSRYAPDRKIPEKDLRDPTDPPV